MLARNGGTPLLTAGSHRLDPPQPRCDAELSIAGIGTIATRIPIPVRLLGRERRLLTCGRSTQSANCCRTDKVNCLRTAAAERLGVGNLKWLPACRVDSHQLRMLLQEVHDRRLRAGRIRCRMSVDLPRVPGGLPPVRHHPFSDRNVRLVHAVIRSAVNAAGSLACWRFGRVHLARSFKSARDLNTEVAQYRRIWPSRVVVDENVGAVSAQPRLGARSSTSKITTIGQCRYADYRWP
jgi:hypothetical protein